MSTSFNLMKNLNENALPKIKKTRVLSEKENKLNEGAGAGYYIMGTIGAVNINSFNIAKTEEDKYGVPTYFLDCDISATLEDVTFESYYDGGHVDSAQIQIAYLALTDNHDPEEKGELNETNIAQSLEGTHVKNLVGGGWIHSTFTGDLEGNENAEGSVYSDFYVDEIGYGFVDEELVKYIDLAVRGENKTEDYIVYGEDYDELERFDTEEKAIEYAENTPEAFRVEVLSYIYDFGGDIDPYSEYSEVVWEKDEESNDIEESVNESLTDLKIKHYVNKAKRAKEKSKDNSDKVLSNLDKVNKISSEAVNKYKDKSKKYSDKAKKLKNSTNKVVQKTLNSVKESEEVNNKLDVTKIANFLKGAIDSLTTTSYTCSWYDLDEDLAIFVGWTDGYDPEDPDYIHAKDEPSFVIAAKIASTYEYMKTDLDWLTQPYNKDTGEVWDTEITLSENENFEEDAQWFINSYKEIRTQLDNGELILESANKEVITEAVVSDKLQEVKSQGNVYMLQDNDKYIVGEDYNKEENLIENAEIYENKEEADKDYFSRCEITRDGKEVNPTEENPEPIEEGIKDTINKEREEREFRKARKFNAKADKFSKKADKHIEKAKEIRNNT